MVFRKLTRAQFAWDVVLAVLLFIPWIPASWQVSLIGHSTPIHVAAWFFTAVAFATAAALRRWSPPLALAIAWVAAVILIAFALVPLPAAVIVFMVLFATSAYGSRRTMWAGLASVGIGSIVATSYFMLAMFAEVRERAFNPEIADTNAVAGFWLLAALAFVACVASMGLAWAAGLLMRQRRRSRELERDRAVAEALAAAEQHRNQIARDMHDVVAHSLAVVIAQSDGARYAAASDPQIAADALRTISTTARGALSDVRLLLTQLRHSQAEGPQPTIADLELVYRQVRDAGVDLSVDVDPVPSGDPPAAVQLAVYRILQEALTNALRHAPGTRVEVGLSWYADRVELSVRNRITAPAKDSPGYGLVGMRERAQLVGGRLDVGAVGGDFVVQAMIPIPEEDE